jgi:aryl-alcohol dehydrogenase-like predicted oxidoreductase
VLSNSAVAVALMGVRNEEELNENIAAADWTLTDSDKAVVNTILEEEGVPTYIDEPQALRSP